MVSRIILFVVLVLSSPLSGHSSEVLRYQTSGLYTEFTYDEEHSYNYYRKDVRKKLALNWQELLEARGVASPAEVERIVELLGPSDRPPLNCSEDQKVGRGGKISRGILLIHGLYDSPYVMKDLEKFFNERCFYTRSILLPGHGTRPGDMLHISYKEWIKAVDFAVDRFKAEVAELYIAGFSTGGALAVRKAIKDPDTIKGLFLFAPALKVKSSFAGLLHGLGKKWVPWQRFDDDDFVKYESITLQSVIEVGRLADKVRAELESQKEGLSVPAMIVLSAGDYTVAAKETIRLFDEGRFGKKSRILVFNRGDRPDFLPQACYNPDIAADSACPKIYYNSRLKYAIGDENYQISDFSHMSLTLSPDDGHYGLAGDYPYCLQYFLKGQQNSRKLCEEGRPKDICMGERSALGSQKYKECGEGRVVRRLTANPLFKEMAGQLSLFINEYIDPSFMLEYR